MKTQIVILFVSALIYLEAVNSNPVEKPETRIIRQSSSSSSSSASSSGGGNVNFISSGVNAATNVAADRRPKINQFARVALASNNLQDTGRNNNGGGYGGSIGSQYGPSDDNNYDYGDDQRYYSGYNNYNPYFNYPNQFQFPQFPLIPSGNQNVNDFGRIGGSNDRRIGGGGQGGQGVYVASGISTGSDGRITTFQSESGRPDIITTRLGTPGKINGVYSSSSFNIGQDGKITSYKDSGHF